MEALMLVEFRTVYKGQVKEDLDPSQLRSDLPALDWGSSNPKKVTNKVAIDKLTGEINKQTFGGVDRAIKETNLLSVKDADGKDVKWTQEFVQAWSFSDDAAQKYLDMGTGTASEDKCFDADYDPETGVGYEADIIGWHGAALENINQMVVNKFQKPAHKSAWESKTGTFQELKNGGHIGDDRKQADGNGHIFQTTSFPTDDHQYATLGGDGPNNSLFITTDTAKGGQYCTPYSIDSKTKSSTTGPNMWMKRAADGKAPMIGAPTEPGHTQPRQFMLVVRAKMTNFVTLLSGNGELQAGRVTIREWAKALSEAKNAK